MVASFSNRLDKQETLIRSADTLAVRSRSMIWAQYWHWVLLRRSGAVLRSTCLET